MEWKLIIPIVASILGALLGAFLGFLWQTRAEKSRNKKNILGIIMAYRGLLAEEDEFVRALNLVDLYFYDNKEVRLLVHDYFKHLYSPLYETGHHARILLSLILAMAKDVGYGDLQANDITDFYFPARYGEIVSPSTTDKDEK